MQPRRYEGLATGAALVLLCVAGAAYANRVPDPRPASSPSTEFSAERAMQHVGLIAQAPHPAGSEAHARVRTYLIAELQRLGLSPQIQEVTGVGNVYPVAGRVRNVLARLPGTADGSRAVLLMAHYDGVPAASAAGDDAAGVGAVIETLRALRAGPPLRNDVIALFSDAEENGLLGAAAFAREHPWASDVAVVMNFEGRGTGGPSMMFESGRGNLDVVRALRGVPQANATSLSTTVYRRLPNDTDLSEFLLLGTPGLNFAFIDGVERYHTSEDDAAHLDPASVQHHGDQALALTRRFGNEALPRTRTPDAVFFDLPLLGLIIYPENWALPIAIGVLVIVALAYSRMRRHEPGLIRHALISVPAIVTTMGVAGVAGYAIGAGLARLHGGIPLGGAPAWSTTYAAAVVLLVVSFVAASYAIIRKWVTAGGTQAGTLLVMTLVSVGVTLAAPGASFVFVWPLLAVSAAAAIAGRPTTSRVAFAVTWLSTAVVVLILVRTTYLMVFKALGLTATGATLLAVLTSITAWLLIPHFETMRGSRPAYTPLIAAGAAVVLLAIGALTVRTDANSPVGAAFAYAVDSDSGKAWLTGMANAESARAWLSQSLQEVATGRADHGQPTWLTRAFDPRHTVPVPVAPQLSAPTAVVLSDSTGDSARYVALRIRPSPGMLAIYVAPDSDVVLSTFVDGKEVNANRYRNPRRRWPLQYVAPPDTGFSLMLALRPGSHPAIGIMGRIDTIPPLQGFQLPQRPPGILPFQLGDVTWVYRRVQL